MADTTRPDWTKRARLRPQDAARVTDEEKTAAGYTLGADGVWSRPRRPCAPHLAASAWKAGQSGSPGGRAKSYRELILSSTRSGEELVELALHIARGELSVDAWMASKDGPVEVAEKPSAKERLAALQILMDRSGGHPTQAIEAEVSGALEVVIHTLAPAPDKDKAGK